VTLTRLYVKITYNILLFNIKMLEAQISRNKKIGMYSTILALSGILPDDVARNVKRFAINPSKLEDEDLLKIWRVLMLKAADPELKSKNNHEYDKRIMELLESFGDEGCLMFNIISNIVAGLNALTASDFKLSDFVHPGKSDKNPISFWGLKNIWKEIGITKTDLPFVTSEAITIVKRGGSFEKGMLAIERPLIFLAEQIEAIGGWNTIEPRVNQARKKIEEKYFKRK